MRIPADVNASAAIVYTCGHEGYRLTCTTVENEMGRQTDVNECGRERCCYRPTWTSVRVATCGYMTG